MNMTNDRLYRSKQVADILGISVRTLYRMLADGRITEPERQLNGYRTWSNEEVQNIRAAVQRSQ
jgi:predicted DNA-binding transcriptional regulator AlpA